MIKQLCNCSSSGVAAPSEHVLNLLRRVVCSANGLCVSSEGGQHSIEEWRVALQPANDPYPGAQVNDTSHRPAALGFPSLSSRNPEIQKARRPDYDHRTPYYPQPWPLVDGSRRSPYTCPREAAPFQQHALSAIRSLGTLRRDRGVDGDGDVGPSRSWSSKQHNRRRPSEDGAWNEQTTGGGGGADTRGADAPTRYRRQANGPDAPSRAYQNRGGGDAGGGGGRGHDSRRGGGGGGSRWHPSSGRDETAAGRDRGPEAEAGSRGRRVQQQRAKGAGRAEGAGPAAPALYDQLRGAGSWSELQQILDSTGDRLLGPWKVTAAVGTYCRLVNGAPPPLLPPPGAAVAAAAAATATEAPQPGSNTTSFVTSAVLEPPPPGLRERLQWELLRAAPYIASRELSYCLYGMAALPRSYSLLVDGTAAGPVGQAQGGGLSQGAGAALLDALLLRLEERCHDVAETLRRRRKNMNEGSSAADGRKTTVAAGSRPRARPHGGDAAVAKTEAGAVEAAAKEHEEEGEEELRQMVRFLTYSCTAVRRLHVVRPSVHRALAAGAAPLLGGELAGEALAPLVIGFLEAGNPEPLFMEQLVQQSALPYSLGRTSSVFAGTVLLRAAGLTGAGPEVVEPLAARLAELLREWSAKQQQQQRRKGQQRQQALEQQRQQPGISGAEDAAAGQPVGGRPSQDDLQLTYVLQACVAAGLGPRSELVQALAEEIHRRQSRWDMLHRLMLARHLTALGLSVVEPAAPSTPQPAPSAADSSASGPAPSSRGPQGLPQPHLEQQQQEPPPSAASSPPSSGWVLLREAEVLEFLRSDNITHRSLLPVLHGMSQLRIRPVAARGGGGAADAAAAQDDGCGAEPASAATAAAEPAAAAAGHPYVMPTGLGVAVQLVDAAAQLLTARQLTSVLTSLAAAGVAAPPRLLQRAEQLYFREQRTTACGGSGGADTSIGAGAFRGHDGKLGSEDTTVTAASTAGFGGPSPRPSDGVAPPETHGHSGGGGGGTAAAVASMCVLVGRVLAWQPGGGAAAMLSDEFVRHCRDAALGATRGGSGGGGGRGMK